jgi:hypothetical protein
MKPTTMIVSMLVAGAVAGVAPQIPTLVKSAIAPGGAMVGLGGSDQWGPSNVQIGWPAGAGSTSTKPLLFDVNSKNYAAYVPLSNTSGKSQCVSIDAYLQGANGVGLTANVQPKQPFKIEAYDSTVQRVELTFTNLQDALGRPTKAPLGVAPTGFLRIYAEDMPTVNEPVSDPCAKAKGLKPSVGQEKKAKPSVQEVRIPEGPLMGYIFLGAMATALLVSIITGIHLYRKLFHVMGGMNWAFEKSWGANVTLGSALLVTLIGLTIFPDRPRLMNKMSYTLLQILFSALVSLAPLVYNLIRREVQVNDAGIWRVNVQGYVIMFLMAGGLVLWAAMGQVATLSVLTEEFVLSGALGMYCGRALEGLAVMLYLLLLVYGFRSLYKTAKTVSVAPATTSGARPGPQPPGAAELQDLPKPMSEWSVL